MKYYKSKSSNSFLILFNSIENYKELNADDYEEITEEQYKALQEENQ